MPFLTLNILIENMIDFGATQCRDKYLDHFSRSVKEDRNFKHAVINEVIAQLQLRMDQERRGFIFD